MGVKRIASNALVDTGTDNGTTTDSYANALDWRYEGIQEGRITLKNTGDSNSLDYKLLTYSHFSGNEYEEVTGSLGAGNTQVFSLSKAYARVKVQVKSTTSGNATTYDIDYIGLFA